MLNLIICLTTRHNEICIYTDIDIVTKIISTSNLQQTSYPMTQLNLTFSKTKYVHYDFIFKRIYCMLLNFELKNTSIIF